LIALDSGFRRNDSLPGLDSGFRRNDNLPGLDSRSPIKHFEDKLRGNDGLSGFGVGASLDRFRRGKENHSQTIC